jgi:hypothetical protein
VVGSTALSRNVRRPLFGAVAVLDGLTTLPACPRAAYFAPGSWPRDGEAHTDGTHLVDHHQSGVVAPTTFPLLINCPCGPI